MFLAVVGDVDLVQNLLLAAGDVETNPGPVPPGIHNVELIFLFSTIT